MRRRTIFLLSRLLNLFFDETMKNLYLDINGVLLTKEGQEADYLLEFLHFAAKEYNCYWLTTHCKGDVSTALQYLQGRISEEAF